MPTGLLTVALGLAVQVGTPAPSETPNFPPLQNAYNQYGFEGQFEQRHAYDTQQNWVHGYFQEIPAYGGHTFFRPYNYKDVMSQSQTSAGWGMSPTMPYSQQFWHKYHDQATMLKLSQTAPVRPEGPAWNRAPASPYAASQQPMMGAAPSVSPIAPVGAWQAAPAMMPGSSFVMPPAGVPVFAAPQQPVLIGPGYALPYGTPVMGPAMPAPAYVPR
jgi:hypothetical protein